MAQRLPTRRQFITTLAQASGGVVMAGQGTSLQGRRAGEERVIAGIQMCWCPAGKFMMGSPASEAGRRSTEAQVPVTLTRGFWAGKFEVTQREWTRAMGRFPDREPSEKFGLGDAYPAYWVSFDDAMAFAAAATRRAQNAAELFGRWIFTLPTEAQWEYACRAGTTTATAFGNTLGPDRANYSLVAATRAAEATGRAKPVGSYPANAWGLHDMHGNVWEWCRDWFHSTLPGGTDPDNSNIRGQANGDGSFSRARRGGAWIETEPYCRSAARLPYEPNRSSDHIGFRLIAIEL